MSEHLQAIVDKKHGSSHAMIVFLDVVKYSMRKSVQQQKVINNFNRILKESIGEISQKFARSANVQHININEDIIVIPTGDGALLIFPFDSMLNMHLEFAKEVLSHIYASRGDISCNVFQKQGWCNCHDFFDVRIGLTDGKLIFFKDINNRFNAAGAAINMASRVMSLGDKQQILLTKDTYEKMIDLTDDMELESQFVAQGVIEVKHGVEIDVYQFIGKGENYLNTSSPELIEINKKRISITSQSPIMNFSKRPSNDEMIKMLNVAELLAKIPMSDNIKDMFQAALGGNTNVMEKFVDAQMLIQQIMLGMQKNESLDDAIENKLPTDN